MKHHRQKLNKLEDALNHYFKVNRNEELSNSKKTSFINANNREALKDLWGEHERIRKEYVHLDSHKVSAQIKPSFSYLDLKIALTEILLENCVFCERKCKINRYHEKGFCDSGETKIASEFLHMGEESPLIPSHTIFFTGCTFKCVYCQNWDISQHPNLGMPISEHKLAEIIDSRRYEGSRNVNFVGGDPNPHLLYILKTIRLIKQNLPMIWNSNFYMSREVMCILDGVVDLYLTDFKYGNDNCALRLSNIPNYWKVVTRNHKQAWKSFDMIIRHLVLPNHVECCTKPILDWIYDNLGKDVVLNIMAQYRPVFHAAEYADISRFLHNQEYQEAVNYARQLGFTNLI
jgi:putative pyruvate formate lyase activating enzyme